MTETFITIGYIFYVIILLGALAVVPLGLPGTWLMLTVAAIFSLISDFQVGHSDLWVLGTLSLVALLAEVLEFYVGIWGSRQAQVSTGAIISSVIGGFIGAFIGVPIIFIGPVLGLLTGVFLGAYAYEFLKCRDWKKSFQSAKAVFFSRVVSLFVKTSVAFGMLLYILYKTF